MKLRPVALLLLPLFVCIGTPAFPQEEASVLDRIGSLDPENLTVTLRLLAWLTVLSLAPSILLLTTAFPRIVIVLGFVRRALSTQEVPPNQVIVGLSLILTFMVMAPTWQKIKVEAFDPYIEEQISDGEAWRRATWITKDFMLRYTDKRDLALLVNISNPELLTGDGDTERVIDDVDVESLPVFTVIPAFLLSEMKRAFEMGFLIYLPFLVIDLVVASSLISMGMLVLPPVLISLPFKILVFVLVDGWGKIVEQVVMSFYP
ncbi:MAG: flagellar type III secretion system pore protein FliP [Planctomycetota bacterium]